MIFDYKTMEEVNQSLGISLRVHESWLAYFIHKMKG